VVCLQRHKHGIHLRCGLPGHPVRLRVGRPVRDHHAMRWPVRSRLYLLRYGAHPDPVAVPCPGTSARLRPWGDGRDEVGCARPGSHRGRRSKGQPARVTRSAAKPSRGHEATCSHTCPNEPRRHDALIRLRPLVGCGPTGCGHRPGGRASRATVLPDHRADTAY
jgi:hypothetical protein